MNVEFTDYLSQRAWHDTIRYSENNREALLRWMEPFLCGAWSDCHTPLLPDPKYPDRPTYCDLPEGRWVNRIVIRASWNDCRLVEGYLLGYEFDWAIQSAEVDKYGQVKGEWKHVYNGGLINHARTLCYVKRDGTVVRPGHELWPIYEAIGKASDRVRYDTGLWNVPTCLPDDHQLNQEEPSWSSHS